VSKSAYNPWWIVAAATVAQIVGQGPILQFTFGVFLKPIIAEFGWTRGRASVALTAALALTAVTVPFTGRLMDRYGVGRVGVAAVWLFGLGLIAIGLGARSPMMFVILYGFVGIVASGQSPLPYTKAIAVTFDKQRGLALGIALNGVGIGSILVPQLAQALIVRFGWRMAYAGIGGLLLVVALPILAFLIGPAAARGAQPKQTGSPSSGAPDSGVSGAEALRDRRLYILGLALFLAAGAANGTIAHVVPLFTDRGQPQTLAVAALGLVGIASMAGRMAAGYALDNWNGGIVAACFLGLTAIGVVLLASPMTLTMASAALICIGLGLGAEANLVGFMVARYFGTRAYGELFGYMFGTFLFASSIGPAVMGLSFDALSTYVPCLVGFAVCLVPSGVLFQFLGPYDYVKVKTGTLEPDGILTADPTANP
jgi:MFS family permease